ncbi:MAG TPA: hypothetical protein VGH15_08950, partial [Caulobacteraceae bacterium]
MTYSNWFNMSGVWTTAADWSAGEPNASLDAYLSTLGTAYTLALSTAAQARSLTVAGAGATFSESAGGSLVARGGLNLHDGTVILDGANALGSSWLDGGKLVIGNPNALGFASLLVDAGELTNTTTVALDSDLTFQSAGGLSGTIAAARGTSFTLGGVDGWTVQLANPVTLNFGAAGADGTVIWKTGPASGFTGDLPLLPPFRINVNAGTLQAGDANFGLLFNGYGANEQTTVAAGATIDLHGYDATIENLLGSGNVTSATAATLGFPGISDFAGQITGKLSILVGAQQQLSGANTYTGLTEIRSLSILILGDGGATGTISAASAVSDDGELEFDHSNTLTVANIISGTGEVVNGGNGTTILTHANTFSGGSRIFHGSLEAASAGALGSGGLTLLAATKFMAKVDFTLPSTLDITGGATLAAASGMTLATSATHPWTYHLSTGTLTFGIGAFTGTVIWNTPAGFQFTGAGAFAVNIATGTLRAGDDSFFHLTDHDVNGAVTATTIAAAAFLDAAGHPLAITNLLGSGTIENTGAATTLNF